MRKAKSKFGILVGVYLWWEESLRISAVWIFRRFPKDCRRRQGSSVGRIPQERATAYMQTCRPACRSAAAASWPGMKQPPPNNNRTRPGRLAHDGPSTSPPTERRTAGGTSTQRRRRGVARNWLRRICTW